jgi:hypothetical protein
MAAYVTGGKVNYERRVKTGDFEHKVAAAEIAFSVEAGANDVVIVSRAGDLAHAQVNRVLGLPAVELPQAVPLPPPEPVAEEGEPSKPRRGRPTLVKPPTPPAYPEPAKAADPAAMGDEPTPTPAELAKVSGNADPAAIMEEDDPMVSEVAEITDQALLTAITRQNAECQNPPAIRKLIGLYTAQDGSKHFAAEIPQMKRAAFLLELKQIAKAG